MDDAVRNPVPQAATAGEYVAMLRDVRRRSGLTYRELARRASAAGHWLPPSTLATMLGRTTLPRERTVVALLAACGTPAAEVERWLETRRDLEARLGEQGRGESDAERTPAGPSTTVAADIRPSVGSVPPRPVAPWPARRWLRLALLAVLGVLTVGVTGALRPLTPHSGQRVDRRLPGGVAPGHVRPLRAEPSGAPGGRRAHRPGRRLVRPGHHQPGDGVPGARWPAGQWHSGRAVVRRAGGRSQGAPSWSEDRIGKHLRRTFPEDPAGAVQVARCLSGLDPYRVEVVEDGSRRWGLFQFSDMEVSRFGVDRQTALDAAWNIRAAREVWSRTGDFGHWNCAA